jgi:hypothetical protein
MTPPVVRWPSSVAHRQLAQGNGQQTTANPRRAASTYLRIAVIAIALLMMQRSAAQVREPGETISAGEGAGKLSDVSRPVGDDSTSVHSGPNRTIGEASSGSVRSGPVRDGNTRSMLSGPVSEMSRGPVREQGLSLPGGSVTEASSGAVKHDIDSPLGERISQPVRELQPLQQQMRAQRERAEQAALANAMQPASEAFAPPAAAPAVVPEQPAESAEAPAAAEDEAQQPTDNEAGDVAADAADDVDPADQADTRGNPPH